MSGGQIPIPVREVESIDGERRERMVVRRLAM
jgi:hypothetical protein